MIILEQPKQPEEIPFRGTIKVEARFGFGAVVELIEGPEGIKFGVINDEMTNRHGTNKLPGGPLRPSIQIAGVGRKTSEALVITRVDSIIPMAGPNG